MMLVVMVVGLAMMSSFGGPLGPPGWFMLLWVVIGLGGAGASFYNAFSRRGLALYEIDMEEEGAGFCPQCGKPVKEEDSFCRHCGASLR
jgi:hypothetical protein